MAQEQIRTPWWSDEVMYWLEDQVVLVFESDVPLAADATPPFKQAIIDSLNLHNLDQFLGVRGFNLQSLTSKDVPRALDERAPHPHGEEIEHLESPLGKHLFHLPGGERALVIGFFNVKSAKTFHPSQDPGTMVAMEGGTEGRFVSDSNTHKIVNLINGSLDKLGQEAKVPIVAAMPNWLGGANCYAHGCPVFPPFPVPERDFCASSRGHWPIQIPALLSDTSPIRAMNGKGVTVFVLDSMPDIKHAPDWVKDAAGRAGKSNKLLNEIADQQDRTQSPFIKFHYQDMPDLVQENALDQLVTGRDINGHLYGFQMPDHGLFVTGIIRDLASEANIEYVRVLNDFGVCSVAVIIEALEDIQNRMMPIDPTTGKEGDLHNKPVVINLSLVVTPSEEDLLRVWFGVDPAHMMKEGEPMKYDTKLLRSPLHKVIQRLTASGAVIVASAGNDSNTPDMPGRIGPRYPAAFPEVIAVGAVDKHGKAARYSDYPQLPPHHNGITTYGGSIPTPEDIEMDSVDAMRGVYSDTSYPAPVAENPPLPDYDPHNANAWAYWSGTSFATPIISAVAARVLQLKSGEWLPQERVPRVHRAILTPEGQQELLTGSNSLPIQPEFGVPLLMAYQCEEKPELQ